MGIHFSSGTVVERIIFENPNNFWILLLDIEDSDAEFDDFKIIASEPWSISWKDKTYFWGTLVQHPKYGNS